MTSAKSFFGALLGVVFVVGPVLAPPERAQAQGTQPPTAAPGKESESERLARRLNAEIDRRDAPVSTKRSAAEQAKYDRELAVENEILRKAGNDAVESYRAKLRESAERRKQALKASGNTK